MSDTIFFATLGALNFVLKCGKFHPSKNAKIVKNQKIQPLNVLKWLILHF